MKNDLKTITILFRTLHHIEDIIKQDVQNYGISVSEFAVLEALYHLGERSVGQLKDKVLIAPSSMTYVLDQLMRKAYVMRRVDLQDQRKFQIDLSEKGRLFMETTYPKHQKRLRDVLNILSPEEETQVQNLLKKIGKQTV